MFRIRLFALALVALVGLAATVCALRVVRAQTPAARSDTAAADKLEIQQLTDHLLKALHNRDVDGCMSVYSDDVVAFDIVPPLQYKGKAAYRGDFEMLMGAYQGPIQVEASQMNTTAGGSVAFNYYLQHMKANLKGGEKVELWLRVTDCLRKVNGKWLIVHEHASVPTEFETGKAALDLKP